MIGGPGCDLRFQTLLVDLQPQYRQLSVLFCSGERLNTQPTMTTFRAFSHGGGYCWLVICFHDDLLNVSFPLLCCDLSLRS